MQLIRELVTRLQVGEPRSHDNLTLFPLTGEIGAGFDYATLDEAIEEGSFKVSEISTEGSVPELKVVNRGDRAVFLLDGEELQGAKQNRVLNLTILVPAGATLVVPVSCVERGRWSSRSTKMESSRDALYAGARALKVAAVSSNYRSMKRAASDQAGLWAAIAGKADRLCVGSPTDAMSDVYQQYEKTIRGFESLFGAGDAECGAIFSIGGHLTGLEMIGDPDLFAKLLPKIVRSYALDAIEAGEDDRRPTEERAGTLLEDVARGKTETFPAVGMGLDVRIRGEHSTGAALSVNERLVHLCAFEDGNRHG